MDISTQKNSPSPREDSLQFLRMLARIYMSPSPDSLKSTVMAATAIGKHSMAQC